MLGVGAFLGWIPIVAPLGASLGVVALLLLLTDRGLERPALGWVMWMARASLAATFALLVFILGFVVGFSRSTVDPVSGFVTAFNTFAVGLALFAALLGSATSLAVTALGAERGRVLVWMAWLATVAGSLVLLFAFHPMMMDYILSQLEAGLPLGRTYWSTALALMWLAPLVYLPGMALFGLASFAAKAEASRASGPPPTEAPVASAKDTAGPVR